MLHGSLEEEGVVGSAYWIRELLGLDSESGWSNRKSCLSHVSRPTGTDVSSRPAIWVVVSRSFHPTYFPFLQHVVTLEVRNQKCRQEQPSNTQTFRRY